MKDWRFPSNQNGDINGINDSGIETFADDSYYSLVRETIQNSLDVHNPSSSEPVTVEFKQFTIPRENLPGINTLTCAIQNCLDSNKEEKDAKRFFNKAKETIEDNVLSVLKVSDYNTRGLEGSDTCEKGTAWSRLIKENGSSNKEDTSGGSKGIGKNATYACSLIRTVFYSSLDISGLKSSFGEAKLVSFKLPEGIWSTGRGYFSEDEKFTAIHECLNLDGVERTTPGTDIYIICNTPDETLIDKIKKSVLRDFFISIYEEKLIVRIQDIIISKDTLDLYMSELDDSNKENSDLLTYYNILTSNDPDIVKIDLTAEEYGEKYGFEDGECRLWLYAGKDNLNRRILMTREAGMRLFEQPNISGSINFTGILQITGRNMNKVFKAMEVPSHDAWKPTRNNNPEEYDEIYRELRNYLRAKVKENFGSSSATTIDAFGVEDFLPDLLNSKEGKELEGKHLAPNTKLGNQKRMKPSKKRTTIKEQISFDEEADTYGAEFHGNNGGKKSTEDSGNPMPNPGAQPGSDPSSTPIPSESGKNKKESFKQVDTTGSRLMCINAEQGIYRYSFTAPNNAKQGKLEFYVSGEQGEFPLDIISAKDLSDSTAEISCTNSGKVVLHNVKKGSRHQLEVQVDFDACCMMEVDYYESKK